MAGKSESPLDDTAAADGSAAAPERSFADTVERWIAKHLLGSVVTRDTAAWNFLRNQFATLKAMLEQEHGR